MNKQYRAYFYIDKKEWKQFIALCKKSKKTASAVLRDLINKHKP